MKGNIIFLKGKNKAGNLVFYTRAGQQIARAKAEFVRNPKTSSQLLVRAKFGVLTVLAKALDPALDLGFARLVDALHSSRNFFFRKNYANVTGTTPDNLEVSYSSLALTEQGDIDAVTPGEANFDTPLAVKVSIEATNVDGERNLATDKVYVMVYNKTKNLGKLSDGTATRSSSDVDVTVPGYWQGDYVEVYLFCTRGSGRELQASETVYLDEGRIS